jgi:DEAD/DEAH box helicase
MLYTDLNMSAKTTDTKHRSDGTKKDKKDPSSKKRRNDEQDEVVKEGKAKTRKPRDDDDDSIKDSHKRHKSNRRHEVDKLQADIQYTEQVKESQRLRAYSDDLTKGGHAAKSGPAPASGQPTLAPQRIRTRSFDITEERQQAKESEQHLTSDEWRKLHSISIRMHGSDRSGINTDPYRTFAQAPYCDKMQRQFTVAGFTAPTAIQGQSWPLALQRQDMICIAKTGSGKTCGFLLPAFHILLSSQQQSGPSVFYKPPPTGSKPFLLVLAPTRELSVQILEEATKFGRIVGIRSVCCYGGGSKFPQIAALDRGVECIIATPGRLNDLLEMKKVNLSQIKFVVFDEADRMLDSKWNLPYVLDSRAG